MTTALLLLAGTVCAAGAAAVFVARRPRHRLLGAAVMAAAALVALLVAAPDRQGALPIAALSAATLSGLLVFASWLEREGRRVGHDDRDGLDLGGDPLR